MGQSAIVHSSDDEFFALKTTGARSGIIQG